MNIGPKEASAIKRATEKHGTLTPRELAIFIDGIAEGMEIKADQFQTRLTELERTLESHGVMFCS